MKRACDSHRGKIHQNLSETLMCLLKDLITKPNAADKRWIKRLTMLRNTMITKRFQLLKTPGAAAASRSLMLVETSALAARGVLVNTMTSGVKYGSLTSG